ncbi:uncharacterized protein LOC121404395 [Drosophila obscura]|uniref:uncharacterized protein LOC121404395 n=1 Tax=Drosophila obscura TaxID=7282 RepID=UPI001BB0E4AD|nr:uncharacterized protein LOC121404395 [Drosophila obscura]
MDQYHGKLCPKLTSKHIYPNSFEKMKVKYATQVFSHTVSSAIKTLIESGNFDDCRDVAYSTAIFLERVNKMFDCLNSNNLSDKNPMKSALQKNNNVEKYIMEMKEYFEKCRYPSNVYCIDGLILSMNSILLLAHEVWNENTDVYFLILSRLNQDALENLFYLIRSRGVTNNNPMLFEFNAIISKMLSMKIITSKSTSGNCEPDDDNMLINVIDEAKREIQVEISETKEQLPCQEVALEKCNNEHSPHITETMDLSSTNVISKSSENALRYFTGFVLYKSQQKFNCDTCGELLKDNIVHCENSEQFLFNKNFKSINNNLKLKAPQDDFFNLIKLLYNIFHDIFTKKPHMRNIKQIIYNQCILQTESDFCFERIVFGFRKNY